MGVNPYTRTTYHGKAMDKHRAVMTEALGRELLRSEVVHHINGDKKDNRLENLQLMSRAEHTILHKQKYPLTKKCVVCGAEFTPHKTKRERAKTCSHECWLIIARHNAQKRCRPIIQCDLQGNPVKEWNSLTEVEKTLGYYPSNICKCCKGVIHSYKGYKWRYKDGE